ncbi:S-methylmethionine-dependent homocysteine/selenocysteine methylase [Vibrio sp. ES.051]|uniref:homocysteine S-methyltransferase family protein n=1 Tax=Vibrio sp. ES.051 TaxID=1761909 RepID=UPI000BF41DBA|nr:homocysteine S-methyltransferase family protein [Vibrio sp. ES.051]PFG58248.1 S-methylmethionine-dependent homocysteine/selenocysteine methylase [Vibrio sp. ES.051]
MKKLTILDGGMGRELKRMGAPFSQPHWSAQALIESPEFVYQAHRNFIQAGAEIIIANSYACVPFHLGQALYEQQGAKLACKAAKIARECADEHGDKVQVAGCIPPAFGSYRPDLFESKKGEAIFRALFEAQDAHIDLWIAETVTSLEELMCLQKVFATSTKPVCYAFSLLDELNHSAQLRSRESVILAIKQLITGSNKSNTAGIYFNCSIPEVMGQAVMETKSILTSHHSDIEIGVYANSFTAIKANHEANNTIQETRELSPEEYLSFAKQWYANGANVIGGCCGIGPEHLQLLTHWKHS